MKHFYPKIIKFFYKSKCKQNILKSTYVPSKFAKEFTIKNTDQKFYCLGFRETGISLLQQYHFSTTDRGHSTPTLGPNFTEF